MIILLSPATLANDVIVTARYKIAQVLNVPPEFVRAKWLKGEGGGLNIAFEVDTTKDLGVSEEAVQAVIQSVWNLEYKRKLEWTLSNVKSVRR